jgi:hypothetical protein
MGVPESARDVHSRTAFTNPHREGWKPMTDLSRRAAIGLALSSGPATRATFGQERSQPVAPVIGIAIAVPIYDGIWPITIGPSRHYHVVISNRSDQTLRFWDDHCSEGEFNVSFEVYEGSFLKVIRRSGLAWAKNFPITVALDPGNQYVTEFSFDPHKWVLPWADLEIGTRRIRMRALYQIEPTEIAGKKGVWTGKIASRFGDYTIRDNRR